MQLLRTTVQRALDDAAGALEALGAEENARMREMNGDLDRTAGDRTDEAAALQIQHSLWLRSLKATIKARQLVLEAREKIQ
jgi:hypothetical protein